MQAHFSIISASIRPEIQEQVAIGLLLVSDNAVFFRDSKNKINVVKELMSPQAIKFLKDSLKQISNASLNENEKFSSLFAKSETIHKSFSFGYLEYLSKYSNNLLIFSAPKTIELQANEALFDVLFQKYVDDSLFIENISESRSFDNSRSAFFTRVHTFFNVEQEITPDNVPGLMMPLRVDLIGKNDIPVYAQVIDLERQNYHIQNDMAVLFMLSKALDKDKAKGFHVSSEPNKKQFPRQHETWRSIKDWKDSEYIDLSEVKIIEEYAIKHGVIPLVQ